jgi:hypothetical protein
MHVRCDALHRQPEIPMRQVTLTTRMPDTDRSGYIIATS